MTFDPSPFERASAIYPQPVALSCGRVCRARTPQERIDAILKCAEVLTRYTCALAICSFAAREDAHAPVPPAFAQFDGNLSFGHFLSVVQAVAQCECKHPLLVSLSAGFRGKGGRPGPADHALTGLLNLRNALGHNLMALSEAKAIAVFTERQPDVLLRDALIALDGLLGSPLFLVEQQAFARQHIVGRRLLLMGESADPIPEEVVLSQPLMHDRQPYLGVKGGAISLCPFLVWNLDAARATYGIYLIDAIAGARLKFVTVNDSTTYDDQLCGNLQERLTGVLAPIEAVTLAGGADFRAEWLGRKKAIEQSRQDAEGAIPWPDFDPATLRWYAHHLDTGSGDDEAIRRVIRDHLLDGRERLEPDEIRQLILLFGRQDVVRRVLRRALIDCRARKGTDQRWDERVESSQNVLQSLKLAIEFFGRHIGVDGATLDGLQATSGSADYIAMREALINLFIHQDYGDASTVSQIEITPDRATFFNAGKSLVDAAGLIEGGRSQSRNPLISRALRLIGFAELAGSGLRELHRVWREAKRRPPIIRSSPEANTFTLILDWRPVPDTSDAYWREKLGVTLSLQEAQVVALSADPAGVSIEQIASSQGLDADDARRLAEGLVTKGLVQEHDGVLRIMEHLRSLVARSQRQSG